MGRVGPVLAPECISLPRHSAKHDGGSDLSDLSDLSDNALAIQSVLRICDSIFHLSSFFLPRHSAKHDGGSDLSDLSDLSDQALYFCRLAAAQRVSAKTGPTAKKTKKNGCGVALGNDSVYNIIM